MIDDNDIQKIGEEMGKIIEHNITPVLNILIKDVDELKQDVSGLKQDVSGLKQDVSGLKQDVSGLKQDVGRIKAEMVTKSYLDDKLADLEGNLIIKLRKEDEKMNRLIEVLKNKSVLNEDDVRMFDEFQIFPRLR